MSGTVIDIIGEKTGVGWGYPEIWRSADLRYIFLISRPFLENLLHL